jgi:hypothetical protein
MKASNEICIHEVLSPRAAALRDAVQSLRDAASGYEPDHATYEDLDELKELGQVELIWRQTVVKELRRMADEYETEFLLILSRDRKGKKGR